MDKLPPAASPYKYPASNKVTVARPRIQGKSFIDEINQYAPAFFDADANIRNVVTVNEFSKYIPLFDKEKMSKMSPEDISALSHDYNQRFSIYYPIRVIDPNVIDNDKGFVWAAGDGLKHKVVHFIRARLRKLNTVDVLGSDAGDIASSCMFNARNSNNPFDTRLSDYSDAIGKMVVMANKDVAAKQDADFNAELAHLRGTSSTASTSEEKRAEDGDSTGLDADWE